MATVRPQLREESVENVLKRAGSVCRVCWVPLLLLSLVSTLDGTVLESYALIPGLELFSSSTNASLQHFNKLKTPEEQQLAKKKNTSSSSQENNIRASRLGFHEEEAFQDKELLAHYLASFQDKGLLARYLASFVMSLQKAVMESLLELINRMVIYESGGKQSKSDDPPLPSQNSETISTRFDVSSNMETKEGVTPSQTEMASKCGCQGVCGTSPAVVFEAHNLGKNESLEMEALLYGVSVGMPSVRFMGGRNVDRGEMSHVGLKVLFMLGVLAVVITAFYAVVFFEPSALVGVGMVAYTVVSTYVGKRVSAVQAIKAGFRTGLLRLLWLAFFHEWIRYVLWLFIVKIAFGGVMKTEAADQLVFRLFFMPFSILAPFKDADASDWGMASRIAVFVILEHVVDALASCVYITACWVTIMERDHWGFAALARAFNLVTRMQSQVRPFFTKSSSPGLPNFLQFLFPLIIAVGTFGKVVVLRSKKQ